MQQRQLRLGDILDDYCPRERRVTNHAVVAMVGADVKQTRCTTCEAEHEYKQAKMPRLRRKTQTPAALAAQGFPAAPKLHEPETSARPPDEAVESRELSDEPEITIAMNVDEEVVVATAAPADRDAEGNDAEGNADGENSEERNRDEGPVHRPLIRASLPRPEGQPPPSRPATDFTIRQPAGRQNRFRQRHQHGGGQFQGNRGNGNFGGAGRGGGQRQGGGRPPQGGGMAARHQRRNDSGRKRSR
jgi:hypothetical protein